MAASMARWRDRLTFSHSGPPASRWRSSWARPITTTPNWDPASAPGAGSVLAEQANQDTFRYTNAAPQHSTMNQGKELWQGLENYMTESPSAGPR